MKGPFDERKEGGCLVSFCVRCGLQITSQGEFELDVQHLLELMI